MLQKIRMIFVMCTISLCMMVKDEQSNIRRCLESVCNIVDEIIIIDTGSTDATKAICREFDAKIFDFKWQEDFSQARNFGLDKASSDWILWMDADEKLCIKDKIRFKKMISKEDVVLFSVKMLHVYGTDPENEKQHHISYNYKLFRRKLGIHFEGAIHENIQMEDIRQLDKSELCDFCEILHYGYLEDQVKEKAIRNIKMLIHEKEINPDNPWLDYHIATELYRLKDVQRAFQFVNHAITGFLCLGLMPPALAYKLKYDILINTNSIDNAHKGIEKAIELYPDYVDLHFYRGIILYYLGQYEEALKAFSYCLVLGEDNPNYLIMSGSGSFYAYFYIGECYQKLNKKEHAKEAYRQAVLYYPKFEIVALKLIELENKNKEIKKQVL